MEHVFIIAEAGVNHNGSLELAKKLARTAKEAGADAVKYQTFQAEKLTTKQAKKAEYQIETTGSESQFDMLKKLELSYDDFLAVKRYCDEIGILFLSTAFDLESVDFLKEMGMGIWKIPSGEINNYPYLRKIASFNLPMIVSTGMSTLDEIEAAYKLIRKYNTNEITILHCTTAYPTNFEDVNLRAMLTIRDAFHTPVGYSDHTLGIAVPIAATALGARVIEKHFTLDKNMEGPDHRASIEPHELKQMVDSIRNISSALGSSEKLRTVAEEANSKVARKSIVAATDIAQGDLFTEENLTVKRPGTGINPMRWEEVMGKQAKCNFCKDELIEL